jgi:hypothetical protein
VDSLWPRLKVLTVITILTAWYPARAAAIDFYGSMFSLNGFGTLGIVHSSEDKADFTATDFEPNGAGYSRSWSASDDSLVGVQVTGNFTPRLSAVLQLVAQQNYNDTYWPHVEWANIKYQVTSDFDVRAGRVVMPTFLVSDSRQVGYSHPWVRPPTELYSLNPITTLDGVDTAYRLHMGEVTSTLQADYGRRLSSKFPAGNTFDANYAWGIFEATEYGAALLRLGYLNSTITLNSGAALFAAFRQLGPQGSDIATNYQVVDKPESIVTLGASYDPGRWFAMGEWLRSRSDSFLGVDTGWYISGGFRFRALTPFLTYSQVTERITSSQGLSDSGLPAYLAPTVAALDAGLNQLLATRPIQYTSTLGVRWDFMKDFDFKAQVDRLNLGAGSPGTLINVHPGFQPGSTVYVLSAAVDFVF